MKSRVVFYLLFTLFAFQGVTAGQRIKRFIGGRILAEAQAAIGNLRGIVQGAVNGAKTKLQQLLGGAKVFGESLITSGSQRLQEETDKALAKIADLRKQAAELGVDIEKCVGQKEDDIKHLPETLDRQLRQCITDQKNEAISIINDSVVAVESTWNAVTGLESELKACGGGLFCTSSVIGDVSLEVFSLPIRIAGQIVKAQSYIVTIRTDLQKCAVSKAAQVGLEAGLILADILKCVGNLQST